MRLIPTIVHREAYSPVYTVIHTQGGHIAQYTPLYTHRETCTRVCTTLYTQGGMYPGMYHLGYTSGVSHTPVSLLVLYSLMCLSHTRFTVGFVLPAMPSHHPFHCWASLLGG